MGDVRTARPLLVTFRTAPIRVHAPTIVSHLLDTLSRHLETLSPRFHTQRIPLRRTPFRNTFAPRPHHRVLLPMVGPFRETSHHFRTKSTPQDAPPHGGNLSAPLSHHAHTLRAPLPMLGRFSHHSAQLPRRMKARPCVHKRLRTLSHHRKGHCRDGPSSTHLGRIGALLSREISSLPGRPISWRDTGGSRQLPPYLSRYVIFDGSGRRFPPAGRLAILARYEPD